MLHTETVEREILKLLKDIMEDSHFDGFNLAGGTALSLYLGHRKSVDLDLFTKKDFPVSEMSDYLIDRYSFTIDLQSKNTLKGFIGNVKVDCLAHKYRDVAPLQIIEGIRLYSMKDISAMKLKAIADNKTRLKDFVDIVCLSTKMSLNGMLESYQEKYQNSNAMTALRGLIYYADIIYEPIDLVFGKYKWDSVRNRIEEMIKNDTKIFHTLPFEQ